MILKKVHMKKRTSQFCTQSPSAGTVWCKLSCGVLCGPPRPESPIHFPLPVYMQSVARETTVFPYFFPFSETKSYGLPIFAPRLSIFPPSCFPFHWTQVSLSFEQILTRLSSTIPPSLLPHFLFRFSRRISLFLPSYL